MSLGTDLGISWGLLLFATVMASAVSGVWSHGRMIEPPARNAMWRFDFDTPTNFEDSELFCGGIKVRFVLRTVFF